MADYWKSIDKKWCDVCKVWLTDNKISVEFHETGRKHKENVDRRLREIEKKSRRESKAGAKLDQQIAMIEQAAAAAYANDVIDNPSLPSLDIKEQRKHVSGVKRDPTPPPTLPPPKILHRDKKKSKSDVLDLELPPTANYRRGKRTHNSEMEKKSKFEFTERVAESSSSSSSIQIPIEGFKKRKRMGNMRGRDEEDD